jgi:hypothetical protein
MKRIVVMVCTVLGLAIGTNTCQASWGHLTYSGYQPWWNIFAKRFKCLTPEEERLQKFWHDYYHAMKEFYCALDHIDWVAYYKNHGYQINACGPYGANCGRINYAPVFVSPTLQWAVPAGVAGGPPVGPPYAHGHTQPMVPFPMMPYPMMPYGPNGHGPKGHGHGPKMGAGAPVPTMPGTSNPDPMGNDGSPMGNDGSPMGNDGSPMGNDGSPMGNDGSPMGNGGSPKGNSGSPMGNGGSPKGNSGSPIAPLPTPMGKGGNTMD